MHTLRPKGDNIAQEFLKLMGQKTMEKTASEGVPDTPQLPEPEPLEPPEGLPEEGAPQPEPKMDAASDEYTEEDAEGFMALLEEALTEGDRPGSTLEWAEDYAEDFESMITDPSDDYLLEGTQMIDEAIDLAGGGETRTASEVRVLEGLSKIAAGLREKGESFAADVVDATSLSIKGDLKKDATRKQFVISQLNKVAKELYSGSDPLAGDMVQVTINKIAGFKQK